MPMDVEGAELEMLMWKPTGEMRWYRPAGGSDMDKKLEVLWERVSGERAWHPVPTVLED